VVGSGALFVSVWLAGTFPVDAQQTNAPAKSVDEAKPKAMAVADSSEYNNWVELGVGGNFVTGDKAQFQHQQGVPLNAYGGIQSFHYEQVLDKRGLLSIDGRGIFDNHDYNLKFDVSHPDKGYVRAGYREYREYYDGSGGWLPSNNLFFNLYNDSFAIDRGDAFFEAGLTLPDKPVFTFRFDHQFRNGTKDSTEWGTTTLTPGATQKKITPAFRGIDEIRDTFEANATHTIKETDFGLGLRYEIQHNNDSQNINMQPNQGAASRLLTQQDKNDEDMFNVHAFTDTRINKRWELTSGYSYTTLHSDISGSRLDTPVSTSPDTRYINLAGNSDVQQHEMNLNLMFTPGKNWYIVPSVRVESEDVDGMSLFNPVTTTNNVVGPLTIGLSDGSALYVAEALEARYFGITNWVFYGRCQLSEDRVDSMLSSRTNGGPFTRYQNNTWNRMLQKYTVGANWYPARGLNFAGQYYHSISDNDYRNNAPNIPADGYPGFIQNQEFNVDDVNFRMSWRPCSSLTLVSRYDFQLSTIDNRGGTLAEVQSGDNTRHMFGETISWTPVNRLYIQTGLNYVLDTTHSPVEDVGITNAIAPLPGQTGLVLKSQNDYWTVNCLLGCALDEKTDAQIQYSYSRADNYLNNTMGATTANQLALVTVPYGAGSEQHNITASLTRQITKSLRMSLKYGFFRNRYETSGGNNNYDAHQVFASMQYRF